jgi:hypothetical protein
LPQPWKSLGRWSRSSQGSGHLDSDLLERWCTCAAASPRCDLRWRLPRQARRGRRRNPSRPVGARRSAPTRASRGRARTRVRHLALARQSSGALPVGDDRADGGTGHRREARLSSATWPTSRSPHSRLRRDTTHVRPFPVAREASAARRPNSGSSRCCGGWVRELIRRGGHPAGGGGTARNALLAQSRALSAQERLKAEAASATRLGDAYEEGCARIWITIPRWPRLDL